MGAILRPMDGKHAGHYAELYKDRADALKLLLWNGDQVCASISVGMLKMKLKQHKGIPHSSGWNELGVERGGQLVKLQVLREEYARWQAATRVRQ